MNTRGAVFARAKQNAHCTLAFFFLRKRLATMPFSMTLHPQYTAPTHNHTVTVTGDNNNLPLVVTKKQMGAKEAALLVAEQAQKDGVPFKMKYERRWGRERLELEVGARQNKSPGRKMAEISYESD